MKQHFNVFMTKKGGWPEVSAAKMKPGTPYCITVDGQTLADQTVTIRDRDSLCQERIHPVRMFGGRTIADVECMTSKHCPDCQRALDLPDAESIRFCMYCGRVLGWPVSRDELTRTIPPQTPLSNGTKSSGGPPIIRFMNIVRLIGCGRDGASVRSGRTGKPGRRVALKCLNRSFAIPKLLTRAFCSRGSTPARISHPNVTFVYGAFQHQDRLYIIMELMVGQSLESVVIREEGNFLLNGPSIFMSDVVDGLDALIAKRHSPRC
jgi:serine/threonine protein kinase